MMIRPSVLFVSCLALLRSAIAFDPTNRQACDSDQLCLTSFIWCGGLSGEAEGCAFPPYSYPLLNREQSNRAALFLGRTYNLTWKNADSRYPVQIQWSFYDASTEVGTEGRWLRNITEPYFMLNFQDMSNEFPNPPEWNFRNQNITFSPLEVRAMAANIANSIVISQPERPPPTNYDTSVTYPYGYWADRSQDFAVLQGQTMNFIETAAEQRGDSINRKWRLGVGIGVGVGVPLLLAAAFFGGWFTGKKRAGLQTKDIKGEDKLGSTST